MHSAILTGPSPGNYTVQGCPSQDHYNIAQIGGSIVPGTTDIGNHGDDQVTTVALPFTYSLYGQAFTSVNLSSNGNAQFTTTDTTFTNQCLPWLTHNYTIYPYWDDLYLVNAGFGIFTSVSGTAPNRIFNIEWRAQYFPGSGSANFELRLYEGQTRFDVIYGTVTNGNTSATAGVQKNDTTFDQYFCNGTGGAATGGQSYTIAACGAPVPSSAVSRKVHGAAGTFDVNLPLVPIGGAVGIEDRTGAVAGAHQEVITFATPVTLTGAAVTSGTGSATFSGSGTAVITVNLTGVTDAQRLGVTLMNVNDGTNTGDVLIPMGVLSGDTNANGSVNAGDAAQTKGQSGLPVGAGNFREDVNSNGSINAGDVAIVKGKAGTSLPP